MVSSELMYMKTANMQKGDKKGFLGAMLNPNPSRFPFFQ